MGAKEDGGPVQQIINGREQWKISSKRSKVSEELYFKNIVCQGELSMSAINPRTERNSRHSLIEIRLRDQESV